MKSAAATSFPHAGPRLACVNFSRDRARCFIRSAGTSLAPRQDMVPDRRIHERRHCERRTTGRFADPRWQASPNIIGYSIEAFDGPLGTVEAYCVEEES